MKNLLAGAALVAAAGLMGCAQERPIHYTWNAGHTGAAYLEEPSLPGDPQPPCRIAPVFWGEPDNWWRWNQVTGSGVEKFCTKPDGHVATLFMPNNMGVSAAPVGYLAPALIEAGGSIGGAALTAGAIRNAANIGASAVTHAAPSIIQSQTTNVDAAALSVNNLSATSVSGSTSGAVAGAIAH
jgi:hypothetical protein